MVDRRPSLEDVLPALARLLTGRMMVAHNAPFDRRVLRQAFARIGLEWPEPPVICTAALARTMLPLQRRRGLGVLADALGIEVELAHRALADAETCARVLCALFPRLCANAATVGRRAGAAAPARRRRAARRAEAGRSAGSGPAAAGRGAAGTARLDDAAARALTSPSCPPIPASTCSAMGPGKVLYVGKSVSIRSRARAHFAPSTPPAAWTPHATSSTTATTGSELGALVLENRLIKELKPPGNKRLTRRDDRLVYIRCRLDIPYPILEVAPDPAAGHAVTIGPVAAGGWRWSSSSSSTRCSGCATAGGGCRAATIPPPTGRWALPVAVPGRSGPQPVPAAAGRGAAAVRGEATGHGRASRCSTTSTTRCDARRPSTATSGRPRCAGAPGGWTRSSTGSAACSRPPTPGRAWSSRRIRPRAALEGFWLAGGRLVDSGRDRRRRRPAARCAAAARARRTRGELGAHVPPDEVARSGSCSWLASHPDAAQLALEPMPDAAAFAEFAAAARAGARAASANGSSTTTASTRLVADGHG